MSTNSRHSFTYYSKKDAYAYQINGSHLIYFMYQGKEPKSTNQDTTSHVSINGDHVLNHNTIIPCKRSR